MYVCVDFLENLSRLTVRANQDGLFLPKYLQIGSNEIMIKWIPRTMILGLLMHLIKREF